MALEFGNWPRSWQVASRLLFGWFQLGQITAYDVKNKQKIGQSSMPLNLCWALSGFFLLKILFPKYSSCHRHCMQVLLTTGETAAVYLSGLVAPGRKLPTKNAGENGEIPTLKQMVVFQKHWMGGKPIWRRKNITLFWVLQSHEVCGVEESVFFPSSKIIVKPL